MKKSRRIISVLLVVLTLIFLLAFSGMATDTQPTTQTTQTETEPTTQPSVPPVVYQDTILKASNVTNGIQLKWNASQNVSYYIIYRREATEKYKSLIAKVTENQFIDENVTGGKRYGYRIVPVMSDSSTAPRSNDLYLYRLGTPTVTAAKNVLNGITVTWTASEGAEGYRLYRKKAGESKWQWVGLKNPKNLTYTDTKVNGTDSYTYAVRGYRGSDLSLPSNYVDADFLAAPKITNIIPNKDNLAIYWGKVEKAATYQLYRKASTEKSYSLVATLDATQLKYYDKNVQPGILYKYLLRAVDAKSKVSAVENATSCLFMSTPNFTSFSNTSNGVKLTWTKCENVQGYNIYRRDANSTAWKKLGTVKGASTLTATDKTAKNGKDYVYVVRGVWNGKQSPYNPSGVAVRFLTAPQNLKVQSKGASGNYLTWSANSGASKYQVLRKTDTTSWQSIGYTAKTSGYDRTAKEGVIYTYTVRAWYGSTYCSAASKTATSSKVDPNGKMVALTYDDGPSNSVTNDILDILEKYDARATFFVIGSRISSNYQPMQRAVKMDCEIGNHTYSHIDLPSYYYDDIREEIDTTNSLVKKYTGVTPKIVRAPGGSTDSYSRQAVNMPFIYWSIDTRDWESRSASSVISIVKSSVEDGDIILMHDIYDSTASASETIIPWLVNQGYQLVTVSELMQYRGINMQNAVSYSNAYR